MGEVKWYTDKSGKKRHYSPLTDEECDAAHRLGEQILQQEERERRAEQDRWMEAEQADWEEGQDAD